MSTFRRPLSLSGSSPIDATASLARAGHAIGALGGEATMQAATNRSANRDKVRQGTQVFVRALNIATGEVQSFRSESSVSLSGIAVSATMSSSHLVV
jgi:hypothetical protein